MPVVTFIRHAESEYNKKGIFCGRIDCNITEEGIENAKKCALTKEYFDIYYCSPQRRTKQTLQAMFPEAIPIEDERLLTMHLGEWEGRDKTKINKQLVQLYRDGKYMPISGESIIEIDRRVCEFINEIFCKYTKNERILVVTSNGVIRSIKRNFIKEDFNINTDNLGYIVLTDKQYMEWRKENDY